MREFSNIRAGFPSERLLATPAVRIHPAPPASQSKRVISEGCHQVPHVHRIEVTGYPRDFFHICANEEHALAVLHATGDRAGQSYECVEYDVYRISNGAVAEFWSFSSDQRATDAFWS